MKHRRRLTACALAALALTLVAPASADRPARPDRNFDLEGHRGARGLRPENTLAAFGKALQIGVTTLELDTGVTKDGVVVVSHERRISTLECRDTGGNAFVGQLVKDLTLVQIKTLDCGTRTPPNPATDPFVGTQESVPGTRMPTLAEVFELADRYGADEVRFNIETKLDPTLPGDTVDPAAFAGAVTGVIVEHGKTQRSLLQSFDWRTLVESKQVLPSLRTVALAQLPTIYPGRRGRPASRSARTPGTAVSPRRSSRWARGCCRRASSI